MFQDLLQAQLRRIEEIFTDREAAIAFLDRTQGVTLDATAPPGLYQDCEFGCLLP
jgi:hypothetical protein